LILCHIREELNIPEPNPLAEQGLIHQMSNPIRTEGFRSITTGEAQNVMI